MGFNCCYGDKQQGVVPWAAEGVAIVGRKKVGCGVAGRQQQRLGQLVATCPARRQLDISRY